MSSAAEILSAEFESLKAEIVAAYEASGVKASGNWGDKLEIYATGSVARISAPDYIKGRKPWNPPPSEAIEQWIKDKGIASRLEKDISISSLAFLIARKIGREGWQPKQGDIIESVATPERIQQIVNKIGESHLEDFTTEIVNYLKP